MCGNDKFMQVFHRSRRRAMVNFLGQGPEYSLNTAILRSALEAAGYPSTRDSLEGECAWLREQGLVTLENLPSGAGVIVSLTPRGLDVARGKAEHPGVDPLDFWGRG